jgi:hypothetical protein
MLFTNLILIGGIIFLAYALNAIHGTLNAILMELSKKPYIDPP